VTDQTPEAILARLVTEYRVTLLRLSYAYLHDQVLAEDAVQETFLKAYRSMSTFRGDSGENMADENYRQYLP